MKHVSREQLDETINIDPQLLNLRDRSTNFTVERISSPQAVLSLETVWRKLELKCPDTILFQSFDWCRNHLEFNSGNPDFAIRVFVIKRDLEIVGILPLVQQNKGRFKLLTGFSEPFQQYTEILLDPAVPVEQLQQALLKALQETGADYFHFGQVRQDGMLARVLSDIANPSGEQEAAPFVSLEEFPDFDTYLKSRRTKTRKNLRNARNRLERTAPVTHRSGTTGKVLDDVIDRVYRGREAWLEQLGITSRAFADARFEDFIKRFADSQPAAAQVETIAMSLMHGDTPISDQWGFVYRGRYYAFMATWNENYDSASPGRLHLGEVIKTCFENGWNTADFLVPASSYKMNWTSEATPVRDYVLPLTIKGKLYTAVWLDLVRPFAKTLFFKLPSGLRGKLLKKILPADG